ncbi:pyridoxine 5'-phosphate synthase [Alcanivorax sp. 97CO-5]|uniref:pyridoxine 5'-phosphate synthase n=1 Tax=unclassified Alcanivorax TaxID=2638842 RepID=UPI0003E7E2B4|nr:MULTISPECIES: pyridoxine 5'-phosphate synthase [unclassified Alcanivorax]EUC69590.1 pyridoxine 5'-phosphate synthase [Alcanivorax sp. 97CO-5]PKG01492.1 pyridoxine 5'-phosphate synthase [Alcanivorax sp. 97CO-6]
MSRVLLGVNIDHIATLRQARGTRYPEPVQAALVAEQAGADGITVHLREDRRHINDRDVELLAQTLQTRMNLEMAATEEMVGIACRTQPPHCCLVPEKREELTTEGGLDVVGNKAWIAQCCQRLGQAGIEVSLFIDAEESQILAARECGAPAIEIHTGGYADAQTIDQQQQELARIRSAVAFALAQGLIVNAGHGLHYHNTLAIAEIPGINELNIGHSIIARAAITGLDEAVRSMRSLLDTV